ncbi:MAG TPA: conjugal transfer protein TraF, partial [Moraxellaceae bacterium]|nr:conjugal transfer protein TraF [Moraxellaceae bacterium]
GRGGAALTMGEYNQAIINPALINKFDENDDFSFALNVGVFASDKDGMVESLDDVQDGLDSIENNPQAGDAGRLFTLMGTISNKMVQVDAGTSILIGIPNKSLPVAFVVKGKASIGAQFTRDAGDSAILDNIEDPITNPKPVACTTINLIDPTRCTQEDLKSRMDASAVGVAEAGLMFGYKVSNLELGATFKAQQIELYSYSETVAGADAADAIDEDKFTTSNSGVNVDLGATMRLGGNGQYVVAGTIENLIPQSFDGPNKQLNGVDTGIPTSYDMKPVLTAAVGYNNGWLKAEANMDLTERAGYDLLADTQFARVGLEFSAGRHLHLRTGYRVDTKDNVSSVITGGIGITPWDRFNIDLSGMIGEGETYGAALQIGFKI